MPDKPLQYESLKAVLQHMEANKRFVCSICMPSIRKTEKLVPLKIDHLTFRNLETRINKTSYKIRALRTCRQYDHSERSEYDYDEDKYGFRTSPDSYPLTPGDVDLRIDGWREKFNGEGSEAHERLLQKQLENYEKLLEMYDPTFERYRSYQRATELRRSQWMKYENRRNNVDSPFNYYIKLTYNEREEKIEYTGKKLFEAMKYLNSFLFGGRKQRIIVKKLTMPTTCSTVLRLPFSLKFKVHQLFNIRKSEELIDESSYPLNLVVIKWGENLKHPTVKTSKKLMITDCSAKMRTWIDICNELDDHPFLVLRNTFEIFHRKLILILMEYWISQGRKVGTTLFLYTRCEILATRFLLEVPKQFQIVKRSDRSITVSMSDQSVIVMSCEEPKQTLADYPWIWEDDDVMQQFWFLKITVEKA